MARPDLGAQVIRGCLKRSKAIPITAKGPAPEIKGAPGLRLPLAKGTWYDGYGMVVLAPMRLAKADLPFLGAKGRGSFVAISGIEAVGSLIARGTRTQESNRTPASGGCMCDLTKLGVVIGMFRSHHSVPPGKV